MFHVRLTSTHTRSLSFRILAIAMLLTQVVVWGIAPLADARPSARAHVEEAGIHLHYSHNPTDCAACVAMQLTGVPGRAPPEPIPAVVRHEAPRGLTLDRPRPRFTAPRAARAPPASLLTDC